LIDRPRQKWFDPIERLQPTIRPPIFDAAGPLFFGGNAAHFLAQFFRAFGGGRIGMGIDENKRVRLIQIEGSRDPAECFGVIIGEKDGQLQPGVGEGDRR
jgi:hypothetical protein